MISTFHPGKGASPEGGSHSLQAPRQGQLAPRPFSAPEASRDVAAAKVPERMSYGGMSFGDIDIFPRIVIQPKLALRPADKFEREADLVAKQVVTAISSERPLAPISEKSNRVQRISVPASHLSSTQGSHIAPETEASIHKARFEGQPLSDDVRAPMERAFGADFSGVRVHADERADRLNRSLQARAFTTGQDIFLRQGEYRPASSEGQRLLAHELTHVVQQSRNPSNSNGWNIQMHPDLRVGHRSRTLRIRWHEDYDVFRERVRNLVIRQLDVPSTWSYQLLHVRHAGDLRSIYNDLDRENPLRSNGTVVIIRAEYNALRDLGASSIEFAIVQAPFERTRIHESATSSPEVITSPNLPVGEGAGLETEPRSRAPERVRRSEVEEICDFIADELGGGFWGGVGSGLVRLVLEPAGWVRDIGRLGYHAVTDPIDFDLSGYQPSSGMVRSWLERERQGEELSTVSLVGEQIGGVVLAPVLIPIQFISAAVDGDGRRIGEASVNLAVLAATMRSGYRSRYYPAARRPLPAEMEVIRSGEAIHFTQPQALESIQVGEGLVEILPMRGTLRNILIGRAPGESAYFFRGEPSGIAYVINLGFNRSSMLPRVVVQGRNLPPNLLYRPIDQAIIIPGGYRGPGRIVLPGGQ